MATATGAVLEREAIVNEIATALRHSFVYGLGGVFVKAVGFLMLPLYTHYLTPKDYGILEMLDLTMSMLGMFLNMGLAAAFLKYYGSAQSESEKRKILSTFFFFALGTGLVVSALGSLLLPRANTLLFGAGVSTLYLTISFWYFMLGYISTVPYTYVRAKEQSGRLVVLDSLSTILLLIVNVILLVFFKLSILAVLTGPLISLAIKLVVLFAWMAPDLRFTLDFKHLTRMLGFGTPLIFSNLTMFTLNFSDRFFLQRFQSLDAVGIYSVGYKFGYMVNFLLIQQFNMMWQARMYIVQKSADHRKLFNQIFVLYSLVLIFAGLGLALFSPELMAVMVDTRYASSQQVVAVVALAYVFLGIGYYLQLGMYLAGRTNWVAVVSVSSAFLNLGLNYVLISRTGMMGAAWATLLGFLSLAAGSYYFSERAFPLGLRVGRVAQSLGLAIGVYLLSRQLHFHSLTFFLVVKTTLLGAFAALVYATGVLSHDEIVTLDLLKDRAVVMTSRWLSPAWTNRV
jgi:O-antigen/teichoic acid export membrane protein